MNWPNRSDYGDALQHPGRVFKEPYLKICKPELNKNQVPKNRSGQYADVYRLMNGTTSTAVKVFAFPNPERQHRYQAIANHLSQGRPACLLKFDYLPEGIRIGKEWFPLLTMEWIDDLRLDQWVQAKVRQRDVAGLRSMADRWISLIEDLKRYKVAHGDLQHGNIMVVKDVPKLVDYDCMCVPALVGRPALEGGLPGYQHPKRAGQTLSLKLDDFSAWIILIALRALAADLSLWTRYVERTGNENLLFTKEDLEEPNRSELWRELTGSRDSDVQAWARELKGSLTKGFDQVPPFEVDPFAPLKAAAQAQVRDWELIRRLAQDPRLKGKSLPQQLGILVIEAERRVDCWEKVQRAIQSGNVRLLAQVYEPKLLDDWPICAGALPRAREAKQIVELLDDVEAELIHTRDGRKLVAQWIKEGHRLRGIREFDRLDKAVERWQRRIEAADGFLAAINASRGEQAISDAWDRLSAVGGHPDADVHRPRAELAKRRITCLKKLDGIPATHSEDNDRALVRVWDEALLKGCREADPWRLLYGPACLHLQQLDDLAKAVRLLKQDWGAEEQVRDAAARLPKGYMHQYESQVRTAQARLALKADLDAALDASPCSDLALAEAFEKAKAAGLQALDRVKSERCERAILRRACLRSIQGIDSRLPEDEQDALWHQCWKPSLLSNCADAGPYEVRYRTALERTALWKAVEKAISSENLPELKNLASHPLLINYPPFLKHQVAISDLLQRAERMGKVLDLLNTGNHRIFAERVDFEFLRKNGALFKSQRKQIEAVLRQWLEADSGLRACDPPFLTEANGGRTVARWTWPHISVVNYCLVATESSGFLQTPDQADGGILSVYPEQYRMAGAGIPVTPQGRRRTYVTVWPVIDLGQNWTRLVGPPLKLGAFQRSVGAGNINTR